MKLNLNLANEVIYVLSKLTEAGYDAYIVGGAIRDLLRDEERTTFNPKIDFDITTNALPEQIIEVFPDAFYENEFGTVSLTYLNIWEELKVDQAYQQALSQVTLTLRPKRENRIIDLANASKIHHSLLQHNQIEKSIEQTLKHLPALEITTYRTGEKYEGDYRRPTSLSWGSSLSEDLTRRDFTVNALALKINSAVLSDALKIISNEPWSLLGQEFSADQFQIIDEHGGLTDLENQLLKTVGLAEERFEEDALRMLRAIRLSVQLNFAIDPTVISAIKRHSALIKNISWERIRDEFSKMLASDYPKEAINLLDETGLLRHILAELLSMKGVNQGGHHTTDVWTHSLDALATCPSADQIVRLATLLHDIGKPSTYRLIDGKITFYNHEIVGSRMASQIAQRLRLSKHDIERIFTLVRYHMFHYQPENTDASVRRFMRKVGLENIDDILDLREGDRLGSGARKTSWRLEEFKQRIIEQLNQPLEVTDLAIDGHDLINELGMKPGPKIGEILQALFERVLEEPNLNERSNLLDLARKLLQ